MDLGGVQVPKGLPASTQDRLGNLARLITVAQLQPDALKKTNQILPNVANWHRQEPMPMQEYRPPADADSLRGA